MGKEHKNVIVRYVQKCLIWGSTLVTFEVNSFPKQKSFPILLDKIIDLHDDTPQI